MNSNYLEFEQPIAELQAKIPLAHQGGYIPHIDHAIPHDVPYEHFAYYWERKKELLGIGSGD